MNVASLQLDALEKSNDEHRHLISKLKLDVDMTKIRARRVKRWDERMKGARSHAAQATIMYDIGGAAALYVVSVPHSECGWQASPYRGRQGAVVIDARRPGLCGNAVVAPPASTEP